VGHISSTRIATLLLLSGEPSKTLCIDELNLTICCRYAETLLKNSRIRRYLLNNHSEELQRLETLLDNFRRESGP
jgi:hypothetical protein